LPALHAAAAVDGDAGGGYQNIERVDVGEHGRHGRFIGNIKYAHGF
jgi:hypothetical protein